MSLSFLILIAWISSSRAAILVLASLLIPIRVLINSLLSIIVYSFTNRLQISIAAVPAITIAELIAVAFSGL